MMFKLNLQIFLLMVLVTTHAASDILKKGISDQVPIEDQMVIAVEELPEKSSSAEYSEFADDVDDTGMDEIIDTSSLAIKKDIFLVLDNSGSMKKNDPDFLVVAAVKRFISLQEDMYTQIGIVIFDQEAHLSTPLTEVSITNRETILKGMEDINYKGFYTDSPAGIERAIYELKKNGRADAEKFIIFMTDGIVDVGNLEKDLEKSKWLREELVLDAADSKIKIFSIAFTQATDFQLLQSIAQKTGGEYYRVLKAENLPGIFDRINETITKYSDPMGVSGPEIKAPDPEVQTILPIPVITDTEAPIWSVMKKKEVRLLIIIAMTIIMIIFLLVTLVVLLKRNRISKSAKDQYVREACINDLQGNTDKPIHKLGVRPTMFGRVSGKNTDCFDYIVVNEPTIGRLHALIEYKDYAYWLVDQESINGTFLNGEPVKTAVKLRHGDRIRLHKCEFEFIMPEMEHDGMTMISNTVFVQQGYADALEAETQVRCSENTGELSVEEKQIVVESGIDFNIAGNNSNLDERDIAFQNITEQEKVTSATDFLLDDDLFTDDEQSEDDTGEDGSSSKKNS